MSFANLYTHRLVADTNAKPCLICFRPATSVLITQDQADFFYVCIGHLKDRSFATPVVDTAAENAAREKRLKVRYRRMLLLGGMLTVVGRGGAGEGGVR